MKLKKHQNQNKTPFGFRRPFRKNKIYFIEERHNNKRSTIISTNLSFSDLRERYSERIFSRFTGYYDFKQIVGTDIRIQRAFSG